MRDLITAEIEQFVFRFQSEQGTATGWSRPIVGFAAASNPLFETLKRVVTDTHLLPTELLPTARSVIAFFLPFERKVARSNVAGRMASRGWALAYLDTNRLIAALNEHVKGFLRSKGYQAQTTPATHNFDARKLVSNWSHRHIGYIAGLGNFGVNNMLITARGCCGRIGSLVTDLDVAADRPWPGQACLYRHDSSCLKCLERCVNAALFRDRFERRRCYQMCLENQARFEEAGQADVCGKCLVGLPCSFVDPVKEAKPFRPEAPGRRPGAGHEPAQ